MDDLRKAKLQHRSIFDYGQSSHISMSGQVGKNSVAIYDFDQGCHIGGTTAASTTTETAIMFNSKPMAIDLAGMTMEMEAIFSGRVSGRSISLYDHGTSAYYNYLL